MAVVTNWSMAFVALLPAFAIPVVTGLRGGTAARLVGVQLASGVAIILLTLVTFVFDQSSFVDIALSLALLTLPGTLVLALFLERWL